MHMLIANRHIVACQLAFFVCLFCVICFLGNRETLYLDDAHTEDNQGLVIRDAPNRVFLLRPNRIDRIKFNCCRSFRVMIKKLGLLFCICILLSHSY